MLKFHIYPIATTADIEKPYLQISIDEDHSDFLQFLWYSDLSEEIISKYRFTRFIIGVTSSQFLLNGIVESHGSTYEKIDPNFAKKVKNHFYADISIPVYTAQKKVLSFTRKWKFDFWRLILMLESGERITKIYAN